MASRSRWKVNYKPIYHLMGSLERNITQAAEEATKAGGAIVHEDFHGFFSKSESAGRWTGHYQTGKALAALGEDFENFNGNIMYKVGFDYKKPHGLAVIFFEKGSPTLTPSPIKIITKARNDKRIIPAMEEVFKKYIEESK
jgi:hypothetical protein